MMTNAMQTNSLGKRYGRTWALRDCTLTVPRGCIAALVGPNGAGKTTLLQLATGLIQPTAGRLEVLGHDPSREEAKHLPHVGFLAQDRPLYRRFTVADTLEMGRRLNPRWDQGFAEGRLRMLAIPLDKKVGKLSGGQAAQVALIMAIAKRPEVLLLDEPMAALDPLARREFMRVLMEASVERELTIVLSSHIIGDLERVCDHLIVMTSAHVQLVGEIDDILTRHRLLIGPRRDEEAVASVHNVVEATHTSRQTSLMVRLNGHLFDASWDVQTVALEEVVLAYLSNAKFTSPVEPVAFQEVTA